jgi:hypothetical protein
MGLFDHSKILVTTVLSTLFQISEACRANRFTPNHGRIQRNNAGGLRQHQTYWEGSVRRHENSVYVTSVPTLCIVAQTCPTSEPLAQQ